MNEFLYISCIVKPLKYDVSSLYKNEINVVLESFIDW